MTDIRRNKFYLYLTEFFSGMAVMAVELGASRLLAPYFSSSQIVWTIVIATIMIAMALGNVFGGRSADRNPDPDRLYRRLLIAAVWIAAIPFAGKYLILGITGFLVVTINQNLLIAASFLACMAIFVYPCFLLGTCTPSLIRFTVTGLGDSGRTAGKLGACNTVGSILGTFLPTFVTIPAVGTAATFLIFSGILLVLALVYFCGVRRGIRRCLAAAALFVFFGIAGNGSRFAFWETGLLYEGESIYNYLQVKEDEEAVVLSTNVLFGVQSMLMKSDSLTGMYYDYALAAPVMAGLGEGSGREADSERGTVSDGRSAGASILILGMGTGTYARQCEKYFDGVALTGVEIDGKITELARTYFDEPKDAEVVTYDGRAYLAADERKYDVIFVDAYQDITIPFQMSSAEFFDLVRKHLKENGVMAVNLNMRSASPDGINTYLTDTIASVFPHVWTVDVPDSTNRELFASMTEAGRAALAKRAETVSDPALRALLQRVDEKMAPAAAGGHILTDDRAPIELLGMRAIDEIIRSELAYYKKVFQEQGIQGLLAG